MKNIFITISLLLTLVVAGCRTQDIRTVEIEVPGMQCELCVERVRRALAQHATEGVKADKTEFDLAARRVRVTYDSMVIASKNIEFSIAAAGYEVNTTPYPIPADPTAAAALPATCREHRD